MNPARNAVKGKAARVRTRPKRGPLREDLIKKEGYSTAEPAHYQRVNKGKKMGRCRLEKESARQFPWDRGRGAGREKGKKEPAGIFLYLGGGLHAQKRHGRGIFAKESTQGRE